MKLKSKDGEDVFVNMMRQLFIFKDGKFCRIYKAVGLCSVCDCWLPRSREDYELAYRGKVRASRFLIGDESSCGLVEVGIAEEDFIHPVKAGKEVGIVYDNARRKVFFDLCRSVDES